MLNKYMLLLSIFILFNFCEAYEYKEHYFKQKVDHFSYISNDTFQQRYLVNLKYYDARNGSIFFYTGNEGDITTFANNTGFMWENAKAFKAGLIFAEHRYYGKSLPYGKQCSKNVEKLGYLSSEQALADFASLMFHIRETLTGARNAPVIAMGGSYGGMLASWIRMKYPHLFHGAIASSAPIWQGLTPCEKFSEIVTDNFKREGKSCANSIKSSWAAIRKIGNTITGARFLTDTFKLCQTVHPRNISMLVDFLSDTWNFLAMTNYPYPTNFLKTLPAFPIRVSCQYLQHQSLNDTELVQNIFKAASVFHNYTGNSKCNDLNSPGGPTLGEKLWDYQTCTEIVQPMCQTGTTDMFEPHPWEPTSFSEDCWHKFKVKPDFSINYIMYGGKNISASSNIIFSNGKLDPWYAGGVLKSISKSLIAIFIDDAAHHLDLRPSNPADPVSVKDARQLMLQWISKWICDFRRQ
ncbi:hypothetical protein JTE90_029121 [Oedothorax gibbosus]|uniref:Lysosomal Pro-X carboxypeptidase n=1 Tax=Oedothorax gibbosus TaxID=931172 RepID=A0AAV6TVG5_9ARAC|nr:hypothetical protein JTE90_029121 [Oedothorax gibbosus]